MDYDLQWQQPNTNIASINILMLTADELVCGLVEIPDG